MLTKHWFYNVFVPRSQFLLKEHWFYHVFCIRLPPGPAQGQRLLQNQLQGQLQFQAQQLQGKLHAQCQFNLRHSTSDERQAISSRSRSRRRRRRRRRCYRRRRHNLRFTIPDPQFTINDLRFTIYDPQFTITIYEQRFTIHNLRSTIYDPRFTIHSNCFRSAAAAVALQLILLSADLNSVVRARKGKALRVESRE